MSVATSTTTQSTPIDALGGSGDALIGMAMLGKTAAALALVIAIILLCTALLKRWQTVRHHQGARLRIVDSTAVGSRERVVVVEIEDTWLVLGVSGGRITKLHERDAPTDRPAAASQAPQNRFSNRLAQALAGHRGKRSSEAPTSSDPNRT